MPPTVVIKTAQGTAISVNGVVIDPTGAVLNNTLVYNGSAFVPGTGGGGGGGILFAYQTIQTNGTPLTARSIANFSSSFTTTDNAGATRTDVDIAPTGVTPGSYTNVNLTVNNKGQITTVSNGSSGIGTLATVYANGVSAVSSTLLLDGTRLGFIVKDAVSGISSTLMGAQTNGGAKIFDVLAGSVSTYVPFGSNIVPTYGIHNLGNGARFQALATPAAPSIAQVGTAGATSYTYYVVAIDRYGNKTLPSPAGTTATGNISLSVSNYNTVSWTAIPGAVAYDILKTNTTTSIGTNIANVTFSDTGQSTSAYTTPTRNNTADTIFDSRISVNGFQIDAGFTTPVAGQSLVWNAAANAFIPATAGGGGGGTLASTYAAGISQASSTMALDTTRLGVLIRDNATPIAATLFGVQNSAGSTKYLDVTTTAVQGQSFDAPTALALLVGSVNASSVQLGRATVSTFIGAQLNPILDNSNTQTVGTGSSRWGAIWALNYNGVVQTQAFSATPTFNTFNGETIILTLTGNVTGWSINSGNPGEIITIFWVQDATGSRTLAGTPGNVKLAGGAYSLSTPANSRDSLTLRYDSVNLVWQEIGRGLAVAAGGGGSVGTLASVYANGTGLASSIMVLDATRGTIVIRDAGSTITNLLNVQNNAGSVSYFVASTAGALATAYDSVTGASLSFGATNATAITIGKSGVVATFPGATISVNGVLINPGYTAPTAGQGLIYSAVAGAFIPQNQTGGGGAVSLQTAYNNGNIINLASSTDVQINWNNIGTAVTTGLTLGNITQATAGAPQQFSAGLRFYASGWNGTVPQATWWKFLCRPNNVGGGNITSDFVMYNSQIGGADIEMVKWNFDGASTLLEKSNTPYYAIRNSVNSGCSYANNTVYTVIAGSGIYIADSTGFYPSSANTYACGGWSNCWNNSYSQHLIASGGTPAVSVNLTYVASASLSANSKDQAGTVTFTTIAGEPSIAANTTVTLFTIQLNTSIPVAASANNAPRMCLVVPYEANFAQDFGPSGCFGLSAAQPAPTIWAQVGGQFGNSLINVFLTTSAYSTGYSMRSNFTYGCQYFMMG